MRGCAAAGLSSHLLKHGANGVRQWGPPDRWVFLFFSNEDIKLELLKNKNLATIFNHLLQSGHISDSPLLKSGRP